MKNALTFFGLLLTALGAGLLWKFGIPPSIDREGKTRIVIFGENEEEKKTAKKYDRFAGSGFFLIIVGSVLQGVALYVA
jgi:hypothetical protein